MHRHWGTVGVCGVGPFLAQVVEEQAAETGSATLTFHSVTVPATIRVLLVICQTGAFLSWGRGSLRGSLDVSFPTLSRTLASDITAIQIQSLSWECWGGGGRALIQAGSDDPLLEGQWLTTALKVDDFSGQKQGPVGRAELGEDRGHTSGTLPEPGSQNKLQSGKIGMRNGAGGGGELGEESRLGARQRWGI